MSSRGSGNVVGSMGMPSRVFILGKGDSVMSILERCCKRDEGKESGRDA